MHIVCQNQAFLPITTSTPSPTTPTPFVFEVEISTSTISSLTDPFDKHNPTLNTTDTARSPQNDAKRRKTIIILYCIGFILGFMVAISVFGGIAIVIKRKKLKKLKEANKDGLKRENFYESMESSLGSIPYTDDQGIISFDNGNFTLRRSAAYGGSPQIQVNFGPLSTLPSQLAETDLCQIEEVNHEFEKHSPFTTTCSHQNPLFDDHMEEIQSGNQDDPRILK